MLRFIIFLSGIVLFTSCGQNKQEKQNELNTDSTTVDSLAILNDPKNNLNIQTNNFTEIDSSGILMFPLSMGESVRDGGSLSYKSIPGDRFWNIIFLNSNTNQYHLLSDKKMLIKNYDYSSGNLNVVQTGKYIFYSITSDDYNRDKKLTEEDPAYLFISDKDGYNFKQISPANYDLVNWQFIKSANKVLMTVKKDSDKNSRFDEEDEVTTFAIEMDKDTEPKEVFSTEFKNKLKILFNRDWQRLKKS